ncbi:MAG: hypothetical protein ACYDBP_09075 [Leptospirales bacterium]
MASSVEAIQKILQETVAPGISDIRVELAGIRADMRAPQSEIKRLDDKIDNGFLRMDERFLRQDARMDHLEDKLSTALEIRERLAELEAKVASH